MSRMTLRERDFRRDMRDRMRWVAWVFVGSPLLILAVGRGQYSVAEAAFLPIVGIVMLLWFRSRPTLPDHVAAVELVQPDDDYTGPDALTQPFYLAWCDCGWNGDNHDDEPGARAEALEHTQHVRGGLHAWGG
jgi:hypothetical protein